MKTANLKIGAVSTATQAEEVERVLSARRGVRNITVHPGNPAGAEVEYDESSVSPELLVSELRERGWDAEIGGASAGGAP
jgi:copper chaperone CopZ